MKAKKRFGQNFLTDGKYLSQLLNSLEINSNSNCLEIGPGKGAISFPIANKAKKLTAIEIDRDAIEYLTNKGLPDNLQLINMDILQFDISSIIEDNTKLIIIGNLPYNLTSMIILKLLQNIKHWKHAYIMVQKEVGNRLCAEPKCKDFSFLTAICQSFLKIDNLFNLPPDAFTPAPKIDSSFLMLKPLEKLPEISSFKDYKLFLTRCFSQRRKKITNVLKPFYDIQTIKEHLKECNLTENARAEELSSVEYLDLYKKIK